MRIRNILLTMAVMILSALLMACGSTQSGTENDVNENENTAQENTIQESLGKESNTKTETPEASREKQMALLIGETEVSVNWEDNESVDALRELVKDEPLTVSMSMYGGFEQVGSLGTELPGNDVEITASPGDIVLYTGNQIVVFYGSNSWGYTKLGRIGDKTSEELAEMLGNGDVVLRLEMR